MRAKGGKQPGWYKIRCILTSSLTETHVIAGEVFAIVGTGGGADVVKCFNECVDICCRKSETEAQDMVIIGGAGVCKTNGCRCKRLLQLEAARERLAEGECAERG